MYYLPLLRDSGYDMAESACSEGRHVLAQWLHLLVLAIVE